MSRSIALLASTQGVELLCKSGLDDEGHRGTEAAAVDGPNQAYATPRREGLSERIDVHRPLPRDPAPLIGRR